MPEQMSKIEELAMPLIDYIKKNYHPYTRVEISRDHIKILMEEKSMYIKAANNDDRE